MTLEGETLNLPLKQPFAAIQEMCRHKVWCHRTYTFLMKYRAAIISLAQEVEMAREYLGWPAESSVTLTV